MRYMVSHKPVDEFLELNSFYGIESIFMAYLENFIHVLIGDVGVCL